MDLLGEADVNVYECNTSTQGILLIESFTALLNSQDDDDCGIESTGRSFIVLHTKLHSPKFSMIDSIPVGLLPNSGSKSDILVDYNIDSANTTLPFQSSSSANSMDSDLASILTSQASILLGQLFL